MDSENQMSRFNAVLGVAVGLYLGWVIASLGAFDEFLGDVHPLLMIGFGVTVVAVTYFSTDSESDEL